MNIINSNGTDRGQFEPYYYRNHSSSNSKSPITTSTANNTSSISYRAANYLNPYYGFNLGIPPTIKPPKIQSHSPRSIPIYKWPNDDNESPSPNIIPMNSESMSEPNLNHA